MATIAILIVAIGIIGMFIYMLKEFSDDKKVKSN